MIKNGQRLEWPAIEAIEADPLACPACHRPDRVEKASSIVKQQTARLHLNKAAGPYLYRTALAEQLSPPPAPQLRSWPTTIAQMLVAWAPFAAVAGLLIVLSTASVEVPDLVRIVLIAATVAIGLIRTGRLAVATVNDQERGPAVLTAWRLAAERWESLFYCFRDDIVFCEGESRWETSSQAETLLYR